MHAFFRWNSNFDFTGGKSILGFVVAFPLSYENQAMFETMFGGNAAWCTVFMGS